MWLVLSKYLLSKFLRPDTKREWYQVSRETVKILLDVGGILCLLNFEMKIVPG